ncbi:hypothetical protein GUJ93_ZPchr0008g14085 [Zizania palustris]|uniref:Uncharacterized protein n=1 Tax=Zizania palustris TaxID=103762 RepID=A0A8J5VK63_ZIZPA|nr:hypothetical protein GUJ93_ZPchr0008g14085 [Zizania palustris]
MEPTGNAARRALTQGIAAHQQGLVGQPEQAEASGGQGRMRLAVGRCMGDGQDGALGGVGGGGKPVEVTSMAYVEHGERKP